MLQLRTTYIHTMLSYLCNVFVVIAIAKIIITNNAKFIFIGYIYGILIVNYLINCHMIIICCHIDTVMFVVAWHNNIAILYSDNINYDSYLPTFCYHL